MIEAVATTIGAKLDAVQGGSQGRLEAAEQAQLRFCELQARIAAALAQVGAVIESKVGALRADLDAAAVARVVQMLGAGALKVADLSAQAGVVLAVPVAAPVAASVVPAPSPAASAPVPAQAPVTTAAPQETLPAEVRENLRLQAGYLNPVKYRDPTTGAGWSGRGPMPKWLKALLVDGKTLADFAVGSASAAPAPVHAKGTNAFVEAAVEPQAAAVHPAAAAEPVPAEDVGAAVEADTELGDVVSFDGAKLDADLDAPAPQVGDDDGIGEFMVELGNTTQFAVNSSAFAAAA